MIEIVNFPTCSREFPNCFNGSFILIRMKKKNIHFFQSSPIFLLFENDRIFSNSIYWKQKFYFYVFAVQFYYFFFFKLSLVITKQGRREYIFLLAICVSICFAGRNRRRGKAKQLKIRFQKAEYKSFRWRGIQHAKVLQQFKSFVNLFLRLTSYLPKISQKILGKLSLHLPIASTFIKYFLSIFPSFFFFLLILAKHGYCDTNSLH